MNALTVGSLFSGIGGFDLGFERAGMRTVWFCEQDPFCRRVLARHWPGVPIFDDVRALVAHTDSGGRSRVAQLDGTPPERKRQTSRRGDADGRTDPQRRHETAGDGGDPGHAPPVPVPVPYVDVLCGGFPCQDISVAGAGAGLDGARSGLWGEYARLIRELRPRYVVVENVAALLARGMGRVLGDLAACGYDAEWDCIPASAVGAPHRRDRVWLVAYPNSEGSQGHGGPVERPGEIAVAARRPADRARELGDADGLVGQAAGAREGRRGEVAQPGAVERAVRPGGGDGHAWAVEPDVGRVAYGIPARVDRLRALGNALVPAIAEWIGHRIVAYEEGSDVTPPGFFPVPDREEWGTPTAHPRTHTPRKVHHGRQLANEVAEREAEGGKRHE